jgi:hypothetical protein
VLLLRSGVERPVTDISSRAADEMVYNFRVAELQNYAVGDAGVLVHNSCSENSRQLGRSLRDNVRPRLPGEQAAHIVPAGNWAKTNRSPLVKDAIAKSQAKVNELLPGGINGHYNGFWAKSGHMGTHTDDYFLEMWRRLERVRTENELVTQLTELRRLAESGAFKK